VVAKLLAIPGNLYDRVLAQCQEDWPREACGIMTGQGGVVRRVYALPNVHPNPVSRYQIDPADQHRAMSGVLAGHEELVAIYHSHPSTPAYPSQTDIAMANYPQAIYLIVSLAREVPEVAAFRIVQGHVTPVPVRRVGTLIGEWVDLR